MSAVAIDRTSGLSTAAESLVLEPVAQRLGVAPILLTSGSITIGSSHDCEVQLLVPGVALRHCVLQNQRGRASVRAIDRRTWHNNLPLTDSSLRVGDRLAVGPVEFRVRAVEPWDVLPPPNGTALPNDAASAPPINGSREPSVTDSARARAQMDTELRRQISHLEAEIGRHQAAMQRLEQRTIAAEAAATPQSPSADVSQAAIHSHGRGQHTVLSVPAIPLVPAPPALDAEHERLLAAIEATYKDSQRQQAELSRREQELHNQFSQLQAELDHARNLATEHDRALGRLQQREEQLTAREHECEVHRAGLDAERLRQESATDRLTHRQSELDQAESDRQTRAAQLSEQELLCAHRQQELDVAAAELAARRQAEDVRLADQWMLLNQGEQAASAWNSQLHERQTHLHDERVLFEQRRVELDHQEKAHQRKVEKSDAEHVAWNEHRQAEIAALGRRRGELDELQSELHARSADLSNQAVEQARLAAEQAEAQAAWEYQKARLWEETQQLESDRRECEHRHAQTEALRSLNEQQSAQLQLQAAETARLQSEWEQKSAQLSHETRRIAAANAELEARSRELEVRREAVETQARANEQRAAQLQVQADEAAEYRSEWEAQAARLTADAEDLATARAELTARQSELETRREEVEAQATANAQEAAQLRTQAEETARLQAEWQQASARLSWEAEDLETLRSDLDAERSELQARREEVEAQATENAQEAAQLKTQAEETARQQAECLQASARLSQGTQELETLRSELDSQRSILEARREEVETQATANAQEAAQLKTQAEETARQQAELQQASARLSQEAQELETLRSDLDTQRSELQARSEEVEAQATANAQEAAQLTTRAEETARQQAEWEQASARLSLEAQELATAREELLERGRVLDERAHQHQTAIVELAGREEQRDAEHSELRQELQALNAERERLHVWSNELTETARKLEADAAGIALTRCELIAAKNELEQVEADVQEFENQLVDYQSELSTRESQLIQAEIECAWRDHSWELNVLEARAVPGEAARSAERHAEALAGAIEHLTTERDQLAAELFNLSTHFDAEIAESRQSAASSVDLSHDVTAHQALVAQLAADRTVLEQDRQDLQHQQDILAQAQAEDREQRNQREAELAARLQELAVAREALEQQEAEFATRSQNLSIEQQSIQELIDFLQTRHGELAQLREDLEGQLVSVSAQAAQQQAEAEARQAEFQERELDLAARSEALAEQEANWQAAQLELQQQRQVAEIERADWQHHQQSQEIDHLDEPYSSSPLDRVSDLEDLVQNELDLDRLPEDEPLYSDAWKDLPAVDDRFEPEAIDSVLDAPIPDGEPMPEADEGEASTELRAKLAEMFNLDLSKKNEAPAYSPPTRDNFSFDFDESQSEDYDDTPVRAPAPRATAVETVAEPDADEYDSVESYMQRLMERNRLSREGFERSQEGSAPAKPSVQTPVASVISEPAPAAVEPVEASEESPAEAEPERAPVVRPAIDTHKVREGLMSLRQVANDSARSAIARSKWNKMRTRLFIESTLAAACGLIGGAIVAGRSLEFVGTSLWGWLAIGIGACLGGKILLNIASIYEVNQIERVEDQRQPAATTSDDAAEIESDPLR